MIRHLVAVDSKRGIAKNGVQPWKLPGDEAYFTEMSKRYGGNVLMGRTTYDVIGHPLPERRNFVASRHMSETDGVQVVQDIDAFLAAFPEDIWVIGGADIYRATMEQAEELYVTEIEADFDCDRFYPVIGAEFRLDRRSQVQIENRYRYTYAVYVRRT
ncbi:MAG TPA: dihydrofolate reductase [Candidatus Saccharimonadales bacterium]|nr:dihydrofolate reductase [Candidatus Saccharimonadales bacterium]